MARMHSRAKGKSGSKKPVKKTQPGWVRFKGKEVELMIVKLAKEGKTSSQIGIELRDVYGIPNASQIIGKKIQALLREKELLRELPEDLLALMRKAVMVRKHLESNAQDQSAKRGLVLTESKINRLVRYYKSAKKLPADWKYDPARASLIVSE